MSSFRAGPSGVSFPSYKEYNQAIFIGAERRAETDSSIVTNHSSPRGHTYVAKKYKINEGEKLTRIFNEHVPHTVAPIGFSLKYVVMEGGECTLDDICKTESRFSVIREIMSQLTHYLMVLKERGYEHLDIKPQNIIVIKTFYSQVAVIDVEGMRRTGDDPREEYRYTPNYAAPEVLFSRYFSEEESSYKMGVASDVWSLVCVLFKMLTKEPLFGDFRSKRLGDFHARLANLHQLEKVLGMPLPEEFKRQINELSQNSYFQETNGSLELVPIGKDIKFLPPWKERIDDALRIHVNDALPEEEKAKARNNIKSLISGMLEIDPNKRTTIEAVHEFFIKNMMVVSLQITESVLQMREHFVLRFHHGRIKKEYYVSGNKPWDCIHFPKDAKSDEPLMLELFLWRSKSNRCWYFDRQEIFVQDLKAMTIDRDKKGCYKILFG